MAQHDPRVLQFGHSERVWSLKPILILHIEQNYQLKRIKHRG